MKHRMTLDGPGMGIEFETEGFKLDVPMGHPKTSLPTTEFDAVVWPGPGAPWELLEAVHPEVPFFLPMVAKKVCAAMAASLGIGFPDNKYMVYETGHPFSVGPFRVTAWPLERGGDGHLLHVEADGQGALVTATQVSVTVPPSTLKALEGMDLNRLSWVVSREGSFTDYLSGHGLPSLHDFSEREDAWTGEKEILEEIEDQKLLVMGSSHPTHIEKALEWSKMLGRVPVLDVMTAHLVARHRGWTTGSSLRLFTRNPRKVLLMKTLAEDPHLFPPDFPIRSSSTHLREEEIMRQPRRYFPILSPGLAETLIEGAPEPVTLLGGMDFHPTWHGSDSVVPDLLEVAGDSLGHRHRMRVLEKSIHSGVFSVIGRDRELVEGEGNAGRRPRHHGESTRIPLWRPKPSMPLALMKALEHLRGVTLLQVPGT